MQNFPFLTRENLNLRHRLSHQQIDVLLNEKHAKEHVSEKLGQLFQVGEFIKLTDAFREADIPCIPLKGPILSYRLYNDASFRYSNDLDFLIPLNFIKKAILILKKNGYQPYFFPWPTNSIQERRLIKFNNQILFVHPNKKLNIEIHWELSQLEFANPDILAQTINSNTIEIQFNERNFKVFNNELELVYLIIHGGLHAWRRLKWLVDVKDFIEKIPIDTEKFTQLVAQLNASRMVSLCNATLVTYFPNCHVLPCKSVKSTKKRLKFTISQIEEEENYNKSFLEKIKLHSFKLHCFPGFRFKRSYLAVFFNSKYLKILKFFRTS